MATKRCSTHNRGSRPPHTKFHTHKHTTKSACRCTYYISIYTIYKAQGKNPLSVRSLRWCMKFWQAARAKLHGKSKSKRLNLNLHFNSSLNADLWIGLGDWLHCLQPGNRPMFRPIHLLLANFLLTLKFSSCCNLQLELHLMMQKMLKLPPHTHKHTHNTQHVCVGCKPLG